MRVLIKYLDLMDKASRSKFIILIFLLFFAGLMELIGLAMIIPIINIILEPEYIYEISREYNFSFFIEDFDRLKLTIFILLLTLFIYIFKNIYLFLVNWYQDGDHYIGWHSDDESQLDQTAPIYTISLGATRTFKTREKKTARFPGGCLADRFADREVCMLHRRPSLSLGCF